MNFEDIKIETGIPLPPANGAKYPFATMNVGDSFFVPFDGEDPNTVRERIGSPAGQWSRRHEQKFTVRRVAGGMRVWRIK